LPPRLGPTIARRSAERTSAETNAVAQKLKFASALRPIIRGMIRRSPLMIRWTQLGAVIRNQKAARRPLQRFCALAALNHGGTPRRPSGASWRAGRVVSCRRHRRCARPPSLGWTRSGSAECGPWDWPDRGETSRYGGRREAGLGAGAGSARK
jgi:hypothetical protein